MSEKTAEAVFRRLAVALISAALLSKAAGQGLQFKGLLSGWAVVNADGPLRPAAGVRLIPEFSLALKAGRGATIDAEISGDACGSAEFLAADASEPSGRIRLYRAWVRVSTSRFEARAGLQKVNFGSASLLRPLMWFDSLDPRDPLQITSGVYALLLRFFVANKTSIWAWGLAGNDQPRGWDILPTAGQSAEFGGRAQVPLFKGEIALTIHRRKISLDGVVPLMSPLPVPPAPEERIGLDGKWDVGVGVWFEAVLIRQKTDLLPLPWRRALNVGLDYTFRLGNGLNALAEHFLLESSGRAFGSGQGARVSSVLLRYPLGLLDEITGIAYYDWTNRALYRFLSWQRTTDRWKFNAILFWNPREFGLYPATAGTSSFSGKGFEVLLAHYF